MLLEAQLPCRCISKTSSTSVDMIRMFDTTVVDKIKRDSTLHPEGFRVLPILLSTVCHDKNGPDSQAWDSSLDPSRKGAASFMCDLSSHLVNGCKESIRQTSASGLPSHCSCCLDASRNRCWCQKATGLLSSCGRRPPASGRRRFGTASARGDSSMR